MNNSTTFSAALINTSPVFDYLHARKTLEGELGRSLEASEKNSLKAYLHSAKAHQPTKPTACQPDFIFIGHGRAKTNVLQCSLYSKKYAMMSQEACESKISAFEKHVVAPIMCTASRKGMLAGVIRSNLGDAPCSLLSNADVPAVVNGVFRPLPFLPKDYFHPLSKRPLFNLLKNMAISEVRNSDGPKQMTLGLGALNKFVLFTDNGKDIARAVDSETKKLQVAGKAHKKVAVVTGNTMTAACVFANIEKLVTDKTDPLFFNGATSNIGKAVITKLVASGYTNLTFHTGSEERAQKLLAEIEAYCGSGSASNVRHTSDASEMWKFKHCVIGSSADLPARPADSAPAWTWASTWLELQIVHSPHFIAFAYPYPKNLQEQASFSDIGNMRVPKSMAKPTRASPLCAEGELYSCFSGTAVHSAMGWTHHEVGDIDVDAMQVCWDAAIALGFSLPIDHQEGSQYGPAVSANGTCRG